MSRILIYREADSRLSRERWDFSPGMDSNGFALTLDRYGIERRKQVRGRFSTAGAQDRWGSSDERHYTSGLSRPQSIPQDVLAEAWASVPRATYIGWRTEEHKLP